MIDQETGMPRCVDYEQYEALKEELHKYKGQVKDLKCLLEALIENIEDEIQDTKKELANNLKND